MARLPWILVVLLAGAVGALAMLVLQKPPPKTLPDGPTVVTQMREVAKLETLDVSLYKKITFSPDPPAPGDSTWENVMHWAQFHIQNPHGRAILFAEGHLGLDMQKLDDKHLQLDGDRVFVVLPPVIGTVELKPGETEIIDSNLDSAQTTQLLQVAKESFEHEVLADPHLRDRTRDSAQRSLRGLLLSLGFHEVQFVDVLPERSRS
jgi:hypothetical protein